MRSLAIISALSLGGCSVMLRSPEIYEDDVSTLVDARDPDVTRCYADQVERDPEVAGTLAVELTVEQYSGQVADVVVIEDETTIPSEMARCVQLALTGMQLAPGDVREGRATYRWRFEPDSA